MSDRMNYLGEKRWIRNIITYSLSRPPCLMFLIFIFTCGTALLCLGLYIQHSEILNLDATQNWEDILHSTAALELCHNKNKSQSTEKLNNMESKYANSKYQTIAAQAIVTVNTDVPMIAVNASVFIAEIPSVYLGIEPESSSDYQCLLQIVPIAPTDQCNNGSVHTCDQFSACISITYAKQAMEPDPVTSGGFCNSTGMNPLPIGGFKKSKVSNCFNSKYSLKLSMHSSGLPRLYLNDEEKGTVHLRLQVGAYILFVVVLSFIIYMALKRNSFAKVLT